MIHTIDATGKRLGRVATAAAVILLGKDKATFRKNEVAKDEVHIVNAAKLAIDQRKFKGKEYKHYTGYPSGLKSESMEHLAKRKGYSELLINAVYGMIPPNKLRKQRMKNLSVTE